MANLSSFISSLNGGIQIGNRFKCFLDVPFVLRDTDGQTLVNKYENATRLLREGLICTSASLPSRRISTTDLTIYGFSTAYPVGIEYQNLSCTFLCPLVTPSQNSVKERLGPITNDIPHFFYSWMNLIQDHRDEGNLNLRFPDASWYRTTSGETKESDAGYRIADGLRIETYSNTYLASEDRLEITGRYRFKNVYPIAIDAPTVDWASAESLMLNVSFAYTHWVSVDKQ